MSKKNLPIEERNENKKEELKKYLYPSKLPLVGGGAFVIIGLVGMGVAASPVGVFILCCIVAFIISAPTLITIHNLSSAIETFETDEKLSDVLEEFENSQDVFHNALRVGAEYMFGKEMGTIIKYKDISNIYQYVHKTNLVEDKREIRVVKVNGEEIKLCKLSLKGKSDNELKALMIYILEKNPKIQIGYNK